MIEVRDQSILMPSRTAADQPFYIIVSKMLSAGEGDIPARNDRKVCVMYAEQLTFRARPAKVQSWELLPAECHAALLL